MSLPRCIVTLLLFGPACVFADEILIQIDQVPVSGFVLCRVDFAAAADWTGQKPDPARLRARLRSQENSLPAQFIADHDSPARGTLVLQLPPNGPHTLRIDFHRPLTPEPASLTARTRNATLQHVSRKGAGFPTQIDFAVGDGKQFAPRWDDRLYHRGQGQFWLREDRDATASCVSSGPLCTVIRSMAAYCKPDGARPPSQPAAVYDWYYFPDRSEIFVRAVMTQRQPAQWHETHFLELTFSQRDFSKWITGSPFEEGTFSGAKRTFQGANWGLISDGQRAIGMFAAGKPMIYDSPGTTGKYLQACADQAWQGWDSTRLERSAWIWVTSGSQPAEGISQSVAAAPLLSPARTTVSQIEERLTVLRQQHHAADSQARRDLARRLAMANRLNELGRFAEAIKAVEGAVPTEWLMIAAGDLLMILEKNSSGAALVDLVDAQTGRSLVAQTLPLFEILLRHTQSKVEKRIAADSGWQKVEFTPPGVNSPARIEWKSPTGQELGELTVTATVHLDSVSSRIGWEFAAEGQPATWGLWRVIFPQLAVSRGSEQAKLLLPQCAGVVHTLGKQPLPRFKGIYPTGWTTMQFLALYDAADHHGLYYAMHDPTAATKECQAEDSSSVGGGIRLAWDIPVSEMGRGGNRFAMSGQAVWQLFCGDWFDASMIYRDWVRREARWYPKLGRNGRQDTPQWMKELSAWAMSGDKVENNVRDVKAFAQALGVPVGFHWYNWHQIPFDNDYPHYFPPKQGFEQAVRELQQANVYVMPYINGRLWDTHDHGALDQDFTRLAKPWATKDDKGEVHIETYSSKESSGDKVQLASMCAATPFWQDKQKEIVLTLTKQYGTRAVYMDQIGAAQSRLCFDVAHGHPLGGGCWWLDQGYWPMLETIRAALPADAALTTECNAEPYTRHFDAFLTWHWQYDGQVPAFPAVYGGSIQMFGRAYRGGPTKELAGRMKAAEQLVFGEQLGWLSPSIIKEKEAFEFFRQLVRLRWQLREYFYAGQMARPPSLAGDIPAVTADWQWHGVWPVTMPAIRTGLWEIPIQKRAVAIFVNVSDQPLRAKVHCDLRGLGWPGKSLQRVRKTADTAEQAIKSAPRVDEEITFAPRQAFVWEFRQE